MKQKQPVGCLLRGCHERSNIHSDAPSHTHQSRGRRAYVASDMTDEKKIEEDERANKAARRANMLSISLAILVIIILGLKLAAFGML